MLIFFIYRTLYEVTFFLLLPGTSGTPPSVTGRQTNSYARGRSTTTTTSTYQVGDHKTQGKHQFWLPNVDRCILLSQMFIVIVLHILSLVFFSFLCHQSPLYLLMYIVYFTIYFTCIWKAQILFMLSLINHNSVCLFIIIFTCNRCGFSTQWIVGISVLGDGHICLTCT